LIGIPEYIADMPDSWNHTILATNDDLIRFYGSGKDKLFVYSWKQEQV